jgi:uncharacterized protein YukE
MPDRVLSSEAAKAAIMQIQSIVTGGLSSEIQRLDSQGKILSQPDVWDGPLAQRFRDETWPGFKQTLDKTQQELEHLREQLNQIATNIMQAGGGA